MAPPDECDEVRGIERWLCKVAKSIGSVSDASISRITITDQWQDIDIGDNSRFKLRNEDTVDILIRTDTTSEDDYWTVEPGECFPPAGFECVNSYQAKVENGTATAELISGK